MALQDAVKDLTPSELSRFACCFLHMADTKSVDWAAASKQYDPKVKVASFKTVTLRALKKLEAGVSPKKGGNSDTVGDASDETTKTKTKGKPGRKRKADVNVDGDDDADNGATPNAKKGRKNAEEFADDVDEAGADQDEDEAPVKDDLFGI